MNKITQIAQTNGSVRIFSVGILNFFIEDWNTNQSEENHKTIKKK